MAYAEALDDLSPEQIDSGCREAARTAEQFPKPGHIRKGYESNLQNSPFLGPPLIDYGKPTLTAEDYEACSTYSAQLREVLGKMDVKPERQPIDLSGPVTGIDTSAYLAWLNTQRENDIADRKRGLSPLPRSREERDAIHCSLPREERRRIKWDALE
jgi:hypothetical protein